MTKEKIFNSFKHSRFPNFSTKKKKKKKFKGPKNKILIKFFFRNRKLSSSSIFSSGATSSQLSTLSIHRSMEYVPNLGHSPGMPKSFQWITLLLIESIYFAGIRVKGPHTSVWMIPSNFDGSLGSTSKFNFNGPLGSTSKLQSMDHWEARPKFNLWTFGKHVQDSNPSDLWEARPNFNPWTSGKHVQNSIFGPLGSTSNIPIHRTSRKYVQTSIHRTFRKHVQN